MNTQKRVYSRLAYGLRFISKQVIEQALPLHMHLKRSEALMLMQVSRLQQKNKKLSVKEIATSLGLASSTASPVLYNLEQLGYLKRQVSTKDRRVIYMETTPKADIEIKQLFEDISDCMATLLNVLTLEEQTQFANLTEKIMISLEQTCKER